jgi:hypothetical protein
MSSSDPTRTNPGQVPTSFDKARIKALGFTELSDGGEKPLVDVVFVHGLQGHPWKTWACKKSHHVATQEVKEQKHRFGFRRKRKAQALSNDAPGGAPDGTNETDTPTF